MIGGVPVLDESGGISENTFQIGDLVDVVPPPQRAQSAPHVARIAKPKAVAVDPLKPGAIVKNIRARIKAIRVELKSHAALTRELAELERLLKAATGHHQSAPVRSLENARRSG